MNSKNPNNKFRDREPNKFNANTASPEKGIFPLIEFPLKCEGSIWAII